MLKQIIRLRVLVVLLLGGLLFCSGAFAMGNNYGRENRGDNRGDNRRDDRRDNRQDRHYYRDGRWYRHDPRGNEIAEDILAVGALIEALPPQHEVVVVQGGQYYHDDRYYYRQAPNGGYVVVAPPRR